MDEEAAALAVLAKRSFDRTPSEVQQLATWLVRACHPFFSSMREDVVCGLCAYVGHAWVEEAHAVYTQGSVGDCMYIVIKGYCSVLKHAELSNSNSISNSGAAYTTAPDSTSNSNPGSPSSRRSTGTQPVSRRATVELQAQQFALATGAVGSGTVPVSRRGTAEAVSTGSVLQPAGSATSAQVASVLTKPGIMQVPSTGATRPASVSAAHATAGQGIRTAASRQASVALAGHVQAGAAGSRRLTAEQVAQKRLAESAQLDWLSRGDSFGEAALVNPSHRRPVSVVAGDEGVMLLVLDRACFRRLQQQAKEGKSLAAAAVQAVLAAACRPILGVMGRGRSLEDVDTLAELFSGLEAFKCMSQPVRTRLAKACQGLQLPTGTVVYEEDDKGDAMYVVVSGSLQVRARPLNPAGPVKPQPDELPLPPAQTGAGAADAATAAAGSIGGAAPGKMRATADAVCAGASSSGGGARSSQIGSSRRTTWEGAAFTAKERTKLDAVRTALEAEKLEDDPFGHVVTDKAAKQSSHMVERDGLYWTAKFMADATAAATASDPQWGLEGGMTPLAAVFASKWRQQVRQQAVVHQAQTAAAEEGAADSKAFAAMEEMLGKAAAKAWKAARDNAAILASATATGNSSSSQAVPGSTNSQRSLTTALGNRSSTDRIQGPAGPLSDDARVAAATVVAKEPARASRNSEASDNGGSSAADAGDADSSADAAAPADAVVPCTPRTAAAVQLLAAAAAATDPVEAVQLHRAALGVKDSADASTLMAEIGARVSLEGLLQAVAESLEKRGLPRRLNKKSSLKITRELNKRMLAGAWSKGYSGDSSPGNSFNQGTAADSSAAPMLKGTGRRVRHAGAAAGDAGSDAEGDMGTEATGLSSCHSGWQSSLDAGSEGTSTYGGGMGAEDSVDGSLMDGIDLAASMDTCPGAAVAARPCAGACSCSCHQRQAEPAGKVASSSTGPDQAGAGCCACYGRASQQRQSLPAMPHATGSAVAGRDAQLAACAVSPNFMTERFGPVIRALGTGDSFGELALLQSTAVRTATVVVGAPDAADKAPAAGGPADQDGVALQAGPAGSGGVLLIKISRSCYDATVRALQVAALEELLGFLSSLPAFRGLSRELLTSLAVFIRPLSAQPGQVLAYAGQPADALVIIQTGELKLLAQRRRSASSADVSPSLSRNISRNGSSNSSSISGSGESCLTVGTGQQPTCRQTTGTQRSLPQQARQPLGRQHSSAGAAGASSYNSSGGGGSDGGGQQLGSWAQLTAQQQLAGVQLAVLGAGSLLGENVLGYNPEEDPLAAIAAASSRKARQAATAAAAALTHHANAVATAPCKLLVLAADDLRRFGRRVRGPLAEAAAARRDWLQERITAVEVPNSSPGQALMSPASPARRVSRAGLPPPPIHGMSSLTLNNNSTGAAAGGLWQGGLCQSSATAATHSTQGGSSAAGGGLWPGLTRLLRPGETTAAAAKLLHRNIPGAAAAASRSQWHQQQWQDNAYGELKQRPQLPTQQQISLTDVARLKQLVPVMQPPCVSELAAAARPFPAGMLTASCNAAAGRGGAKGLQLLLSGTQNSQMLGEGAQAAVVGSPKWAVGAGGSLLPAGSAVQAVPASGRRGPMAGHLERGSEA